MNIIDELNRFLEDRLEEFLKQNPHLELQALDEELSDQLHQARQRLSQFEQQEKTLQMQIVDTAKEVELWHRRVRKAEGAGRQDLAQGARNREQELLNQGNHLWKQMQVRQTLQGEHRQLIQSIEQRRQELHQKMAALKTEKAKNSPNAQPWPASPPPRDLDPLEHLFQQLETDLELEELKKQL